METIKVLAIIQARASSTRLPGKVIKEISGKTLIELMVERIKRSKKVNLLILATSLDSGDNVVEDICSKISLPCYRGSLNDVLDRFYKAALIYSPDIIVRLTGDCPLIDSIIIDNIIEMMVESDYDYISNTLNPTYPDGMDVEVFRFSALEAAYNNATFPSDREHVTPYIWRNSSYKGGNLFKSHSFENKTDLSRYRLTVDYPDDFMVIQRLVAELGCQKDWIEYVSFLNTHPEVQGLNSKHSRNEGYIKSVCQDAL